MPAFRKWLYANSQVWFLSGSWRLRSINEEDEEKNSTKEELPKSYKDFKSSLGKLFGSRIGISVEKSGKGKIVIPFKSAQDFERIVKTIENDK